MRLMESPEEVKDFLKRHKYDLDMPHAYLGEEPNTYHRNWHKKKLRILLAALWRYEDFRGNQTIPLLYQMLNGWRKDIICERAHFPSTEKEYNLFKKYRVPLFSLESKQPAQNFDIIMTSLSFLPPWINFPLMLEMSGIPPLWTTRNPDRKTPLIMVGGSAMYGNFCIAYPVVDMIYLGDAEEEEDGGLFSLLSAIEPLMKEHELTIEELVQIVQKDFDYIFCPSLYSPLYNKERFIEWRPKHRAGVGKPVYPVQLRRRICKDLDKAPMYTKPIPSYTDTTMGLGEIEISRGCRGMCAFCGIGWKYRPYRERSKKVMIKALTENKREGGATALCPIATEFAFYSEKRGLIGELCKISRYVDPLSMRVDAFVQDEEFDRLLSKLGMNQAALGIEAVSQRLRNRLFKGVSEEDILRACRIAADAKFKKIKFFMISNIDETWEDFEEFFALLEKIKIMNRGRKLRMTCSWTPLFIEPCTPLQWKKPTIEQRQDWNRVDNILMGTKDKDGKRLNTGLEIKFALGIKNEENFLWMMQGMHLGDTRFAEAVVRASIWLERPFYVSFAKTTKEAVSEVLKETGGSWDYIMRERKFSEKFPWDIVNRGVPKKSLMSLYKKIVSGKADKESISLSPKMDNYPLPGEPPCKEQDMSKKNWYLIKYHSELEIVPNTHWRAQIHRAAWKAGIPIATNRLRFFSDRDNQNWYGGADYFGMGVKFPITREQLLKMNHYLTGMQVVDCLKIEYEQGTWNSFYGFYRMYLDKEMRQELGKYLMRFDLTKKVLVRKRETRYFSGERSKKVDIKPLINSYTRTAGSDYIDIIIKDNSIGIRAVMSGIFSDVSFKRILKCKVVKGGIGQFCQGGVGQVF